MSNESASELRQLNAPPEVEQLPAEQTELRSDQVAYQAAYHMAVGRTLKEDYSDTSADALAAFLGELDGQAQVIRNELERRFE